MSRQWSGSEASLAAGPVFSFVMRNRSFFARPLLPAAAVCTETARARPDAECVRRVRARRPAVLARTGGD